MDRLSHGTTVGASPGLGMNKEELGRNSVLTEHVVHDLNVDPKLPYDDNSFDVVTNAVSVDYLNQPLEVGTCGGPLCHPSLAVLTLVCVKCPRPSFAEMVM